MIAYQVVRALCVFLYAVVVFIVSVGVLAGVALWAAIMWVLTKAGVVERA